MATRKQRSRRAKTFRHDFGLVDYDEEGNEVEVTASELRAKKGKPPKTAAKAAPTAAKGQQRPRRALREPPVPSWRRSFRRGLVMMAIAIVFAVVLFPKSGIGGWLVIGIGYTAFLVPLTYWIDGFAYRRWQRSHGQAPKPPVGKAR